MTQLPSEVQRYLDKRGLKGPWGLAGNQSGLYYGAVVIPSLAEGENLFATLDSLVQNPQKYAEQFLVVVVVNQGEDVGPEVSAQNHADLAALSEYANRTTLNLAWVDVVSYGLAFPSKQAGVGSARKLGMDLALDQLDWSLDPVLVCLDADTLVEDNYFESIEKHFASSQAGAAVLPFQHQPAASPVQQAAIDRYELFLRSYVFGLSLAGSPYAFNTVGSAMACRANAYIRCGGMNVRKAGEDYYFLQKLAKTDGVASLKGTVVSPQPRPSERVPFGTGRSITRLMNSESESVLFYPVGPFKILSAWLSLVSSGIDSDAEALLLKAREVSPQLATYLEQLNWLKHWPVIQKTNPHLDRRLSAFHVWFDGFRSLKLIHFLCEELFSRGEPEQLMPEYFAWQGKNFSGDMGEALEMLRSHQGV